MYRGTSDYARLARAVRDFEFGTRAFQVPVKIDKCEQIGIQTEDKEVKLLVRPDARVNNVESKIHTLANQLVNLTLTLINGHDQRLHDHLARKRSGTGEIKNCLFCSKPGHGSNRCHVNPNRDIRCLNCGKLGHRPGTCWSEKKHLVAGQVYASGNQNQVTLIRKNQDPSSESDDESSSSYGDYHRNDFHVIHDKETSRNHFLAVKRGADGQPLPKNPRLHGPSPMNVYHLLNPARLAPPETDKTAKQRKKSSGKKKAEGKKKTNPKRRVNLQEPSEKYDVVSALTNA